MREKDVERKLVKAVWESGGLALKFVSPGFNGVPDRHKVMVETEIKKRFLGIPYTVTEKKHIMVDGKTYRQMKRDERERKEQADSFDDEMLACAAVALEEEFVDLFGE